MSQPQKMYNDQKTGERLSAVERDVTHLGSEVRSLGRKMDEGLATLASSLDHRLAGLVSEIRSTRTPVTALSGWAAVILTLVGAVIWPQMRTDDRHEAALQEAKDVHFRDIRLLDSQFAETLKTFDAHIKERMQLLDATQDQRIRALERAEFGADAR